MSQLGINRLAELRGQNITESMKALEKAFLENAPFIAAAGKNPVEYLASPLLKIASQGKQFSEVEMFAAKTVIQHADSVGALKRHQMDVPVQTMDEYKANVDRLSVSRVAAEKAMAQNSDKIKSLIEGFNTKLENVTKLGQGVENTQAQKVNVAKGVKNEAEITR
jgi:hypothetical protein